MVDRLRRHAGPERPPDRKSVGPFQS
jgi:hypothetical protein